jgi:hypothetical protein
VQDDDRQDALDVLDDALFWQLPPGRWVEIERVVRALDQALTNEDDASFRRATADLELLGPVRAASAENPPSGPSPEPARGLVRERINELVRSLVRPQGGARPTSGR